MTGKRAWALGVHLAGTWHSACRVPGLLGWEGVAPGSPLRRFLHWRTRVFPPTVGGKP